MDVISGSIIEYWCIVPPILERDIEFSHLTINPLYICMNHFICILQSTSIHALDLNCYRKTYLHKSHVWFVLSSLNSSLLSDNNRIVWKLQNIFIYIQRKMQTLNGILCPEIAKLATKEVRRYGAGKKGYIIKLFIMQMAQYNCSPKRKIELSYNSNGIF